MITRRGLFSFAAAAAAFPALAKMPTAKTKPLFETEGLPIGSVVTVYNSSSEAITIAVGGGGSGGCKGRTPVSHSAVYRGGNTWLLKGL